MPSPGEDVQSWSTVAADNGSSDPLINWVEGQTRASVNNSSRSELAAHAKDRNLRNGSIVTTGTANAQQFLSGVSYTTVPTGLLVKLKIGAGLSNNASATLNMDGIGDVLIKTSNGENLRGNELVAGCYTDFVYNGTNWIFLYSYEFIIDLINGGGGVIIGKQIFSAPGSASYTPTAGMQCCIIECVGGGGGGGGASSGSNEYMTGGGGGGGGYARTLAIAADIGVGQTITIGAGGTGSAGGGAGGSGGQTQLGTLCQATGGAGGGDATNGLIPPGGVGGVGVIGDLLCNGGAGGPGFYSTSIATAGIFARAGSGGSSVLGGGGQGCPNINGGGGGGGHYGGGAGGSSSYNGSGLAGGSFGGGGIVIVTEYAGRGAPGRDGVQGSPGPIGPVGPSGPGTGDVLRFGTPVAGQLAVWTDASHIQGGNAANLPTITNVVIQTFTASGTYTPTTGMKFCILECVGGGGGAGSANAAAGEYMVGGGGGSGGYSRKRATAADIGVSKAVTVGAGGAGSGGVAGAGSSGGSSTVGTLCIANGGLGGDQAVNGAIPAGGAGGVPGTGDIIAAGAPGMPGFYNASTSNNTFARAGTGGSSFFGGGGAALNANAGGGIAGGHYGGGASGSVSLSAGLAGGAPGGAGVVIITEYI